MTVSKLNFLVLTIFSFYFGNLLAHPARRVSDPQITTRLFSYEEPFICAQGSHCTAFRAGVRGWVISGHEMLYLEDYNPQGPSFLNILQRELLTGEQERYRCCAKEL